MRVTAETITDEQIHELRCWAQTSKESPLGHSGTFVIALCAVACREYVALLEPREARRELAEIWNARHGGES